MIHYKNKKRKKWPFVLLAFVLLLSGFAFFVWRFAGTLNPEKILNLPVVRQEAENIFGGDTDFIYKLLPHFLGFSEPRTVLLLFQNNTELRPSGGFIGSYATVRINKGKVDILRVEGSENLDWQAPDDWIVEAPSILKEELKVEKWYFRDSNWSPDFVESAKKALEFYIAEGGVVGEEIDTVIAITPTVLEKMLELSGSVIVDGIEFDNNNVTEKLEYEVEFGFRDRGIPVGERKQIIGRFMSVLLKELSSNAFSKGSQYFGEFKKLAEEKHILAFSKKEALQNIFDEEDLSGRVKDFSGDYLMWVDANLAALKTDHAIEREVSYKILSLENDAVTASTKMTYNHTGEFDWRTSRYRTYARLYVPNGAKLLGVKLNGNEEKFIDSKVDTGTELGKTWFGYFTVVEPGQIGSVEFVYELPKLVFDSIDNGEYKLFVQKQPGTIEPKLTLDLNFDKPITGASPAEAENEWGDSSYKLETNLREDREFGVELK